MIELFISYSMTFMGVPYKWGGNNRIDGYDCSGFVQECLRSIGEDPRGDQTAQDLWDYFASIHVGHYSRRPKRGDLLFFGKDLNSVGHIAIALDSKTMIECGGGNSNTKTLQQAARDNAMVRVRPIFSRSDFLTAFTFL